MLAGQGLSIPVQQVDDRKEMDRYLLGGPPGLVIKDQLVIEQRLPTKREELRHWIIDGLSWERK